MFNFIKSIFGSNTTQNDVSGDPLTGVMIDNIDSKGNVVSQKLFERFNIVGESFQKKNIKKIGECFTEATLVPYLYKGAVAVKVTVKGLVVGHISKTELNLYCVLFDTKKQTCRVAVRPESDTNKFGYVAMVRGSLWS